MIWLLPLAAYLLGSLSFAYWAGRLNGIDLCEHGSHNLGATNAARVLGGWWFLPVFTLDLGKGLAAVVVAKWLAERRELNLDRQQLLVIATAVAVVLGHSFTCFHRLRGGKAVATSLGVLIALLPMVAALGFAVWLAAWLCGWLLLRLGRSGAVGLASVIAAIACCIIHLARATDPWRMPELPLTIVVLLLALLVVIRHRSNIAKLMRRGG